MHKVGRMNCLLIKIIKKWGCETLACSCWWDDQKSFWIVCYVAWYNGEFKVKWDQPVAIRGNKTATSWDGGLTGKCSKTGHRVKIWDIDTRRIEATLTLRNVFDIKGKVNIWETWNEGCHGGAVVKQPEGIIYFRRDSVVLLVPNTTSSEPITHFDIVIIILSFQIFYQFMIWCMILNRQDQGIFTSICFLRHVHTTFL